MHQGIVDWVRASILPDMVEDRRVLDVGSADLNGSMRKWFLQQGVIEYHGIDIVDGIGVDEILSANDLLERHGSAKWDLILCLEMLEHAEKWQNALYQMKESLKQGGWLLLTTRSPGYPFHAPPDYWRFTKEVLREAFSDLQAVETWSDPGFFVSETTYALQPGVYIRGQRQGEITLPMVEAEAAPPDLGSQEGFIDPKGFMRKIEL